MTKKHLPPPFNPQSAAARLLYKASSLIRAERMIRKNQIVCTTMPHLDFATRIINKCSIGIKHKIFNGDPQTALRFFFIHAIPRPSSRPWR
jgi:hypothetical protein